MHMLDFDSETLPWTDRFGFHQELETRVAAGEITESEAESLEIWHRDGYLSLGKVIEPELIDALLEEVERGWRERPEVQMLAEGLGVRPWREIPPRSELDHHHYRLMDFQEVSESARRIILHPEILRWLRLVFDRPPVAMQSLYFEYGSEQRPHQDFPYVQAQTLSHLVGCWVACEDVRPESGPLVYYPGSHRIPKFDWGGGSLRADVTDEAKVAAFEQHVERASEEAGLERVTYEAEKGEVLFWHAALVHGGSAARDHEATRKSFVVHYSTAEGYPRDRRYPHRPPRALERNGGSLYLLPEPDERAGGPLQTLLGRLRGAVGRVLRG